MMNQIATKEEQIEMCQIIENVISSINSLEHDSFMKSYEEIEFKERGYDFSDIIKKFGLDQYVGLYANEVEMNGIKGRCTFFHSLMNINIHEILFLYSISINNSNLIKFFNGILISMDRFKVIEEMIREDKIKLLNEDIFNSICSSYSKEINSKTHCLIFLFKLYFNKNMKIDDKLISVIKSCNPSIILRYIEDDSMIEFLCRNIKDDNFIVQMIKCAFDVIIDSNDLQISASLFKKICKTLYNIDNINNIYFIFLENNCYGHVKVLAELGCRLPIEEWEVDFVDTDLKLETLLLLQHLENYDDFVNINQGILYCSKDRRIGKYLDGFL